MEPSHKLYVLVDKTLSRSQQTVQACHAVAEFVTYHGAGWKHQSMVILAVDNENKLHEWDSKLFMYKKAGFYEPYWNGRFTALAVYGCDEEVKNLRLL